MRAYRRWVGRGYTRRVHLRAINMRMADYARTKDARVAGDACARSTIRVCALGAVTRARKGMRASKGSRTRALARALDATDIATHASWVRSSGRIYILPFESL